MSTAHYAETDGQSERANRTLEDMLRCFVNYRQNNWSDLLPTAEFAYNSAKNSTTGHSPFYVIHGYEPKSALDLLLPDVDDENNTSNPPAEKYLSNLQTVTRIETRQVLKTELIFFKIKI